LILEGVLWSQRGALDKVAARGRAAHADLLGTLCRFRRKVLAIWRFTRGAGAFQNLLELARRAMLAPSLDEMRDAREALILHALLPHVLRIRLQKLLVHLFGRGIAVDQCPIALRQVIVPRAPHEIQAGFIERRLVCPHGEVPVGKLAGLHGLG